MMRDGKLRSVKCFVKLILMWATSLGCLTSSSRPEIILAGRAKGVKLTHTHTHTHKHTLARAVDMDSASR